MSLSTEVDLGVSLDVHADRALQDGAEGGVLHPRPHDDVNLFSFFGSEEKDGSKKS